MRILSPGANAEADETARVGGCTSMKSHRAEGPAVCLAQAEGLGSGAFDRSERAEGLAVCESASCSWIGHPVQATLAPCRPITVRVVYTVHRSGRRQMAGPLALILPPVLPTQPFRLG